MASDRLRAGAYRAWERYRLLEEILGGLLLGTWLILISITLQALERLVGSNR